MSSSEGVDSPPQERTDLTCVGPGKGELKVVETCRSMRGRTRNVSVQERTAWNRSMSGLEVVCLKWLGRVVLDDDGLEAEGCRLRRGRT